MSKNLRYSLVQFDDRSTLTLFYGSTPLVANNEHPNWEAILKGVTVDDDPAVADLFDITVSVAEKFRRLGERVVARDNRIYFDGDEVNNSLSRKIMEFIKAGVDDWQPLVRFMEKCFDNPQEHSREQLFDWLMNNEFAINEDGDILGYKGVQTVYGAEGDRAGFTYQSIRSGVNRVTVDEFSFTGHVPQNVGSVVEMARSEVEFDPAQGCSNGLHISNYKYARSYGDTVLLVALSPRDVVSVPTQDTWQKVRACRYRVVEVVDHDKARYENVNPLHREVPESVEVVTPVGGPTIVHVPSKTYYHVSDFTPGDRVELVGKEWIGSGHTYDDLWSRGVGFGHEGTVEATGLGSTTLSSNNVLVKFDNVAAPLYVSPTSLEFVDEEDDYDRWDDDGGYSW